MVICRYIYYKVGGVDLITNQEGLTMKTNNELVKMSKEEIERFNKIFKESKEKENLPRKKAHDWLDDSVQYVID